MRILAITPSYNQTTQNQNKRNINFEAALVPGEVAEAFIRRHRGECTTLGKVLSRFHYYTNLGDQRVLYQGTVLQKFMQGIKAKGKGTVYLNPIEERKAQEALERLRLALQEAKRKKSWEFDANKELTELWGAKEGPGKEARETFEALVQAAEQNPIKSGSSVNF